MAAPSSNFFYRFAFWSNKTRYCKPNGKSSNSSHKALAQLWIWMPSSSSSWMAWGIRLKISAARRHSCQQSSKVCSIMWKTTRTSENLRNNSVPFSYWHLQSGDSLSPRWAADHNNATDHNSWETFPQRMLFGRAAPSPGEHKYCSPTL